MSFWREARRTEFKMGEESLRQKQRERAHFLGRADTRAEIPPSFSVPPITSGPNGVKARPRVSARGSDVSSSRMSQRLLCRSNTKLRGEISSGFPSWLAPL